ncbi:tail fiber/spike domain-containing protein [Enterobacter bugandensis]|uniref:tail fiber/spike domain-containing protein n=1 Tax=Enterobacter bugandensis TaxID=881260 RepID=UPI002D7A08B4|nr:hypothetical protein [Enterobacter bugandensis]WRT51550.1 hypothetical protein VK758_00135 [Enterobacter bugandensis]
MAEQKVKLTDLPAATDTVDTAQLLINQNSTDQKLPVTHFLRGKNNLSDLADIVQSRANLDVPSVDEVNEKLSGLFNGNNSFTAGASLASRTDFIWDENSKSWYYWSGTLPKDVPAASTPESTGGIGAGAWVSVGDAALRSDLSGPNAGMSGVVTRGHMLSKLVNDTSLSIGQSFRCIDRADGIFDVVDINSGQPNGFNLVAHNSLQVALKLRINGRTVDIEQMGAKPDGSEDILPILNAATQMFASTTGDAYDAGCTILLKENIYLLSSWTMPSIFQNLSLVGNGAKIKCKASGTYPHLIKTGWNFQNISGVDIDGALNENYTCVLNINNGYGRYENITIRNAKLPIRVGLPGTNPVSLSEFYFDRLVITGCAKIAECIGLYSVLQISDSVLASGEGTKWKSYDCTGLATYGGRIFVNKCTMNSNIVTTDSPYIFVSSTVEQGNTYCGQVSIEQSDLEMRSRTILVSDQSTNFQNTQQNIRLSNSRVSVWLSEEPRAKTFFESNSAYRGLFSVTNCDVIFNQPLTERPIKAGIRTLCKLDYSSFNDVGYYGSNLIEWSGFPPIEEFSLKMKASISNNQSLAVGQNKISYDQTLKDIYGTDLTLNKKFNVGLNRFECPNGEIESVELVVNYLFSAAVTSPVEWRIDVFFSGSSTTTTICKHTTPTGVTTGSFCVALPMIDQDSTITTYATTNATATLLGGNVFNNTISLLCKTKRPRVMS